MEIRIADEPQAALSNRHAVNWFVMPPAQPPIFAAYSCFIRKRFRTASAIGS